MCVKLWTPKDNAFTNFWSVDLLRVNAPPKLIEATVEKTFKDEAKGIFLIPVWKNRAWFHALERVAIQWMDLPSDMILFVDDKKRGISPRRSWLWRIVDFDALGINIPKKEVRHFLLEEEVMGREVDTTPLLDKGSKYSENELECKLQSLLKF